VGVEDGPYRARRPTGGRRRAYEDPYEDPQDVLARHGLLDSDPAAAPPGGRAARRRAAERLTDSGRHAVDPPPARYDAAPQSSPRSGHRYRADEPDSGFRNGYATPDEAGPRSARNGGRRRADSLDAPPAPDATTALPPAGARRYGTTPDTARPTGGSRRQRAAEPSDMPPAGIGRRRPADDFDEPAAPRRRRADPDGGWQDAVESSGPARVARRHAADFPDEPADVRFAAGEPAPRRARRTDPPSGSARRPTPYDDPYDGPPNGRRHPAEALDPAAPTRRRRTEDSPEPVHSGAGRRPPDYGEHVGSARRHRTDPVDAPDAPRRSVEPGAGATTALPATAARRGRGGDHDADAPPTTAIPTGARPRRRRLDPTDAPDVPVAAATTALPARRRESEPDAPATTALPTTRRRPSEPPDDAPVRRPRARPADADEPSGRSRAAAMSPEATVAVRRAPRDGDGTQRSERDDDAHTRAMRIDETLTRLTAAHAGVTLAVTDRRVGEPSAPPQRRGPAVIAGRLLAGAMALMVLATTAFGWGTKTWLGSTVRDAAALDPGSSAVVDAAAQDGDENVLVVATKPASDSTQPRADTVAVAHIPDSGGPVTVLAFPLDLEINRPPCERWDAGAATYADEPEQAEARTQLVSALDIGGPRCVTRVVQQLSGLAITKYVGIDLAAVPAMTDAVGGAEVCVPRPVLDGVLGPVVPDPGRNRLTGVRAADFVQAGDVEGEPSPEYGRIQRQQQVLAAVLDSAVSGTALLDVGRIMALRPALANAVLTDGAGIDQVLALAMTLRRLDADGVRYAAVPTGERNARGNAVIRDTDAAALFAAVRADQPLPADVTDPGAGTAGPAPSDVSVEVVNASTRSGLAGEVSETLSSLGFNVGEPSSADQPTSETVIRFSPDQAAAAEVLRATVPSATEVPDPGSTGVLQLVLGRSFDDVVRAPSEPIALTAPTAEASAEPAVTCT
jgi:LCP family protein required for cell wall assembly